MKAKGFTANLHKGTPAVKASLVAGSFETNQEAKIWIIKSPNGEEYSVRNLSLFCRTNPELFENKPEKAIRGFIGLSQSLRGKRKRKTYQWRGWRLLEIPISPEGEWDE